MIPDIGERKMKRNRIIAMLLGMALLVCGCQQTPKATDEEKKIEAAGAEEIGRTIFLMWSIG